MSVEETRVVVDGFLENRSDPWLAEDAELYDPDWPQGHRGRPEVTAWFARWDHVAPIDGWLFAGDGRAAAELALHAGTGPVVHAAAIFEVQAGEIVCLRLYYDPVALSASPPSIPS